MFAVTYRTLVMVMAQQTLSFDAAAEVYPGVESLRAERPIRDKKVPTNPLWLGPLPEGTYTLVPVKREPYTRSVDLLVDGEWKSFSYVSMIHPEVDGFTREQGSHCVVSHRRELYYVRWKVHYCQEPPRPMKAWEWENLLGRDD